jgi:hypothetical protein
MHIISKMVNRTCFKYNLALSTINTTSSKVTSKVIISPVSYIPFTGVDVTFVTIGALVSMIISVYNLKRRGLRELQYSDALSDNAFVIMD